MEDNCNNNNFLSITNNVNDFGKTDRSYTQSLSFLIRLYQSIYKLSKERVDLYTLNQITHFPLIICEKLINVLTNRQRKNLTQDEFTTCFNTLYFGNIADKAKLIAMICDFKQKDIININDVKILLIHFHMRIFTDQTEKMLYDIIDNFFDGKETITIDEFLHTSFEKNIDIIEIFISFFEKYCFFSEPQMNFFDEVQMKMMYKSEKNSKMPILKQYSQNGTVTTTMTSSNNFFTKASSYQTININHINVSQLVTEKEKKYKEDIVKLPLHVDPFDDDAEMRNDMNSYDKDYEEIIKNYQMKNDKVVDVNSMECEFGNAPLSCEDRNGIDQKKLINNFFYSKYHQHLNLKRQLNSFDDNNILKESADIKERKKEIVCYRLNKKMNKYKYVKLIFISNMIFYYHFNQKTYNFIFKKVILIEQLYPKEIKVPFFPVNVACPIKDGKISQLQIISSLHNNQIIYDFYSASEDDFSYIKNYLELIQNIRSVESIYEMENELGHGKFGKVVLATHKVTGEKVSIKTVAKFEKEHSEENFNCLQWEKDIFTFLCHVSNKYVERCFEYFETPTYIYYVNEYISGGDLKNLILNNPLGIAKSIGFINDLTRQLIKGMLCLHQYGIIHRDIKHTNTLVSIDNKKSATLKLIDFGLSKVIGYEEFANEHYGSLSFKAPELINGTRYTFNVDIWAIGVTIYFIIYGSYPVKAENKHLLKKKILAFNFDSNQLIQFGNVNDYMNKVMMKCFVKDPRKRPNIFALNKVKLSYDDDY